MSVVTEGLASDGVLPFLLRLGFEPATLLDVSGLVIDFSAVALVLTDTVLVERATGG